MTFVLVLAAISILISVSTLLDTIRHDRRGRRQPPASHVEDHRFVAPAAW